MHGVCLSRVQEIVIVIVIFNSTNGISTSSSSSSSAALASPRLLVQRHPQGGKGGLNRGTQSTKTAP